MTLFEAGLSWQASDESARNQARTDLTLRNVQSVLAELPIVGRLLNYGRLTVRGFGGSRDSVKHVRKLERVLELIEEHQPGYPRKYSNWRKVSVT